MELFHLNAQRSTSKKDQAQALVETALGMVIIVIIMAGLIDLGRIWFIYTVLEDAAGEGALYLAIKPDCPDPNATTPTTDCTNPGNAAWRIRESSKGLVQLDDPLTTRINTDPDSLYPDDDVNPGIHEPGETVYIEIEHDIELLTPFIQGIAGSDGLTLTVDASQVIVKVP